MPIGPADPGKPVTANTMHHSAGVGEQGRLIHATGDHLDHLAEQTQRPPLTRFFLHRLQQQRALLVRLQPQPDADRRLLQQLDHRWRKELDVAGADHQRRPHLAEFQYRHRHHRGDPVPLVGRAKHLQPRRVADIRLQQRLALPERWVRQRQRQAFGINVLQTDRNPRRGHPPEPAGVVVHLAHHHQSCTDAPLQHLDHCLVQHRWLERAHQQLTDVREGCIEALAGCDGRRAQLGLDRILTRIAHSVGQPDGRSGNAGFARAKPRSAEIIAGRMMRGHDTPLCCAGISFPRHQKLALSRGRRKVAVVARSQSSCQPQ